MRRILFQFVFDCIMKPWILKIVISTKTKFQSKKKKIQNK
jgi:hypothetical protein